MIGAMALGMLHGIEPGHGWPLAASYALGRRHRFAAGLAASLILGVGHLISSLAVVLVFWGFKEWLALDDTGWLKTLAGVVLIGLGCWELRRAHHGHEHGGDDDPGSAGRGLWAMAVAAFALGFVHEEEFQIIGLCAGSGNCLALMLAYALTVIVAMVVLTLALIAGFERWRQRLAGAEHYLPYVSGLVLIVMGVGFLVGVL